MVKIISERFAGPDDPIYHGGIEMFTNRKPKKPSVNSPKNTDGVKPAKPKK